MDNNTNQQLNIDDLRKQRRLSLFLVILCGAALLAVFIAMTLGWFAVNKKVSADGMQITAQGNKVGVYYHIVTGETVTDETADEYWQLLDDELDLDFRSYISVPGTSCEFRIKVQNEGPGALDVTVFGLDAPIVGEEIQPMSVGGKNYYLGTQLTIEHLADGKNTAGVDYSGSIGAKSYLTNNDGSADRILLFEKEIGEGIKLLDGDYTVFRAIITFENKYDSNNPFNPTNDQNVYKRFGSEDKGGICRRRLYIEY